MSKIQSLTQAEQIEYYLGKDHYNNKFFRAGIPEAWEIEFCNDDAGMPSHKWSQCKNTTVMHNNIEFRFNNLGYRSHYDYVLDDLQTKRNILCISDSYVFGPTSPYEDLWTMQLQKKLPHYNIVQFGLPGWSFDTVARVGCCVLQALKSTVDYVLVIVPNEHRREFVSKQYKKIVSFPHTVTNIPYAEYWDHIDWKSNNYNLFKNSLLLRSMTENQGGQYIELTIRLDSKHSHFDRQNHGLSGPKTYQALTNYFYKKITNQPSLFQQLAS